MVWWWQQMLAVNLLSCSPWLPCAQTSHWRKTRLHLVSRGSRVHRALSLPPVAAVLSAWALLAPLIRQGSLAGHDPACNGLSCYCRPASGHPFFTHCRGCSAGISSILISCPVLSRNYSTGLPSFSVDFMVPCLCPWTASSPPAPVLHVVSLVLMGFPWFLICYFLLNRSSQVPRLSSMLSHSRQVGAHFLSPQVLLQAGFLKSQGAKSKASFLTTWFGLHKSLK